jgi:hypothetical protein
MLDDVLEGDIAASLALLDRMAQVRDPRWAHLSTALGKMVHALDGIWADYMPTENLDDTRWGRAYESSCAHQEFQTTVSAIFWRELHSLRDLTETQELLKRSLELCREPEMVGEDGK